MVCRYKFTSFSISSHVTASNCYKSHDCVNLPGPRDLPLYCYNASSSSPDAAFNHKNRPTIQNFIPLGPVIYIINSDYCNTRSLL